MEVDIDFLLAVYRSALDDSSALYCSAPITSGRRFIRWVRERSNDIRDIEHAAVEHADEHRAQVVEPNLEHASAVIRRLRQLSPIPVIDPTVVPHVPVWTQEDWLRFWERVIARFVIGVVFVNDWQFSYGCAHEFMYAHARGIAMFAEDGSAINFANGRGLVENAIAEIDLLGGATARLESAMGYENPLPVCPPADLESLDQLLDSYRQHASERRDSRSPS